MKTRDAQLWSREVTRFARRSRAVSRAEERFGARRPPITSRREWRALVQALETARWKEAA